MENKEFDKLMIELENVLYTKLKMLNNSVKYTPDTIHNSDESYITSFNVWRDEIEDAEKLVDEKLMPYLKHLSIGLKELKIDLRGYDETVTNLFCCEISIRTLCK